MNSKVRHIIYGIISFVLSFVLFLLSFAIVLQSTILNPSYIMDNMNTSNYFVDKRDEIKESLVDLGYASGLDEKFFENVVDEVTIHDNTQAYLNSFYAGEEAKIDTTAFKQKFNSELDSYISKNNLKVANDGSREYLINQAANIYAAALRIPLFATLSVYLIALKNMMPLIIGGLAVLVAILCVIIIFTNRWKHRAVRYICYSTSAAFLTVGIIPAVLLSTGYMSKINIDSRAFYNLFVLGMNNILIAVAICSAIFFIISVGLFFLHKSMRRHASED
ncbi:hypothetical protein DW745_00735 [Ruminococcus sp. AM28-29LB]|jgi:hypothetical protein|nr:MULTISPECIES: hypothetical protein [Ruminococcus]RGH90401.1 hypothetical protein DW745_00735 [Ruminococcus sp. AM28-29LB]